MKFTKIMMETTAVHRHITHSIKIIYGIILELKFINLKYKATKFQLFINSKQYY